MNFLYKFMGKATEISLGAALGSLGESGLMAGEEVMHAFKLAAYDVLILTSKRIIRVEKRMVGSQPWRNVRAWSYQVAGALDADSELYLHMVHQDEPLTIEFAASIDVAAVAANIGAAVCGSKVRALTAACEE